MKRIWIGVALLAVLLLAGIWTAEYMEEVHLSGASDLRRASVLALEDDWARACAYAARAQSRWKEKWFVTASFADHEPMDEIDAMFTQLQTYARGRDGEAFSAACAHLAEWMESMGRANSLTWWNLL